MNHVVTVLFDFNRSMHLAQDEPKRFEELRLQMIEAQISASTPSSRKRLRGLQFQIDARRRLSGSAMSACVEISGMMFDHLYDELLPAIYTLINDGFDPVKTSQAKNNNVILSFPMIKGGADI